MILKDIRNYPDLHGKTVLVRASLNVPLLDGTVRNWYRLKRALPTLEFLQQRGARIIVVGHIGRAPEETLRPVFEALSAKLPMTWGGPVTNPLFTKRVNGLKAGEILMAENLRQQAEETENKDEFAQLLASFADIYVNDAFANMHRNHASMVGVPDHIPAFAGANVVAEVTALSSAMQPRSPSLFMLGGAKFETKLQLVERYLEVYDEIFVGGALAHDLMRARGLEIGRSLVSDVSLAHASFVHDDRVKLPADVIVDRAGQARAVSIDAVEPDDVIFDCGPNTVIFLSQRIATAGTVLWNGPFGNYEAGYTAGTEEVARTLADSPAESYVGGGDTVAAIEALDRSDDFTFVSTGGGAMLAFLEHGSLPALDLLIESK